MGKQDLDIYRRQWRDLADEFRHLKRQRPTGDIGDNREYVMQSLNACLGAARLLNECIAKGFAPPGFKVDHDEARKLADGLNDHEKEAGVFAYPDIGIVGNLMQEIGGKVQGPEDKPDQLGSMSNDWLYCVSGLVVTKRELFSSVSRKVFRRGADLSRAELEDGEEMPPLEEKGQLGFTLILNDASFTAASIISDGLVEPWWTEHMASAELAELIEVDDYRAAVKLYGAGAWDMHNQGRQRPRANLVYLPERLQKKIVRLELAEDRKGWGKELA